MLINRLELSLAINPKKTNFYGQENQLFNKGNKAMQ